MQLSPTCLTPQAPARQPVAHAAAALQTLTGMRPRLRHQHEARCLCTSCKAWAGATGRGRTGEEGEGDLSGAVGPLQPEASLSASCRVLTQGRTLSAGPPMRGMPASSGWVGCAQAQALGQGSGARGDLLWTQPAWPHAAGLCGQRQCMCCLGRPAMSRLQHLSRQGHWAHRVLPRAAAPAGREELLARGQLPCLAVLRNDAVRRHLQMVHGRLQGLGFRVAWARPV